MVHEHWISFVDNVLDFGSSDIGLGFVLESWNQLLSEGNLEWKWTMKCFGIKIGILGFLLRKENLDVLFYCWFGVFCVRPMNLLS